MKMDIFGFSVDLERRSTCSWCIWRDSETADSILVLPIFTIKSDGSVTLLEVLSQPAGKSADNMGVS